MTKRLVVFYSRTGTTKKIAQEISRALKADVEEIIDTKNRSGALGYILAGKDATQEKTAEIMPLERDARKYDLVIIGTPVWAWNMTPAVRAYLKQNKDKIKKAAFFCTEGGSGAEVTFKKMHEIIGKKPISTLELKTSEVTKNEYLQKLKEFLKPIK